MSVRSGVRRGARIRRKSAVGWNVNRATAAGFIVVGLVVAMTSACGGDGRAPLNDVARRISIEETFAPPFDGTTVVPDLG